MRYINYFWDFDGTLFDSHPHSLAAFHEVMERHGIAHELEKLDSLQVVSFDLVREYYQLSDAVYNEAWARLHSWSLRPPVTMYPATEAILRAICASGGRNYLYTLRNQTAWQYLQRYGLDRYFSGKVDGTMGFPAKPAPDAVNFLCDHYKLDRKKTVMVGDREIDVAAGANGGIAGCLFVSHEVDTNHTVAAHIVHNMEELASELEIPLGKEDVLSPQAEKQLQENAAHAAEMLCLQAKLSPGQLVVVSCSIQAVAGQRMASSPEVANAVFAGLRTSFDAHGIGMAVQCDAELNRALVIEREAAQRFGYTRLNAIPMPMAGGFFATTAWELMRDPVVVREIKADAGLDIGDTLIGMHLKQVAVPLSLNGCKIGQANLIAASTRPILIGGEHAGIYLCRDRS